MDIIHRSCPQSVRSGGILAVSATDSATLQGKLSETCFSVYGSVVTHDLPYKHELSARVLVNTLWTIARDHGRSIEVKLAVVCDFFVRVFVEVSDHSKETSTSSETAVDADASSPNSYKRDGATNTALILHCPLCHGFVLQPISVHSIIEMTGGPGSSGLNVCDNCETKRLLLGPIYTSPLFDRDLVRTMLSQSVRFNLFVKSYTFYCSNNILVNMI